MIWLLVALAWAGTPFDFDAIAVEGELQKPSASILLPSPVRGGASADEARARVERAEASAAVALPERRAEVLLELGDARAALASALLIERLAAEEAAWSSGSSPPPFDRAPYEAAMDGAVAAWGEALGTASPLRPTLLDRQAWGYEQLDRPDDARRVWTALVAEHPDSPEAVRARLALAELYFAEGAIDRAIPLYEQVAAASGDGVGAYAAYKLAWCLLNLGRYAEAADRFAGLARDARSEEPLREEAARDAVLAAAHLDPIDALGIIDGLCGVPFPYRSDASDTCVHEHRARLARIYRDQGREEAAAAVEREIPTRGGRR